MSTVHRTVAIGNDPKKNPETINFYNSTKYGVDVVDQMARLYSTKVGSRRWPIQVFYDILDLAGINAVILYKEVTGQNIYQPPRFPPTVSCRTPKIIQGR